MEIVSESRLIRRATVDDADLISVLSTHVWVHTYAESGVSRAIAEYLLRELGPTKWVSRIAAAETDVLVVEQSGRLVGVSVLKYQSTFADVHVELETLYVLPSHARSGT